MFKLVTGSPGDGKTSNELWAFLNADEYKNRPKYCTPIKGFAAKDHGVTEIEHIKEWQTLPEGAVIFCDEVQDYCGTDLGAQPPEWVKQLARHRHSGYDFICTTQSPMYLHPFARKLAKPHVHYIRPWNMKMARYTWDTVQNDPTTKSAKAQGQSVFVKPNPEVFKLYTSTVLDTHKSKPPYKLLITLGVGLMLLIGGSIYAFTRIKHIGTVEPAVSVVESRAIVKAAGDPTAFSDPSSLGSVKDKPVWTEQTIKPRMPGSLYSAPVYDGLTAPTDFPRVAACMSSKSRGTCNCYTQQGTSIDVPTSACYVFTQSGSFDPWLTGRKQQLAGSEPQQKQPLIASVSQSPVSNAGNGGVQYTSVPDSSRGPRTIGAGSTIK